MAYQNSINAHGTGLIKNNGSGVFTGVNLSIVTQVFTSSGTYTPTAGMQYCVVEAVGGGGGGGGSSTTDSAPNFYISCASGGGGGGYCRKTISAATIGASQAVTIGAAGAAGLPYNMALRGGTGGTTTFGAILSATGGLGGYSADLGNWLNGWPGGTGGVGSGGDFNTNGSPGGSSLGVISGDTSESTAISGMGGSSFFGGGAVGAYVNTYHNPGVAAGVTATSYGGGGSGSCNMVGGAAGLNGGAGFAGIVIVTEYIFA